MKAILLAMIGCLGLGISGYSYSGCGSSQCYIVESTGQSDCLQTADTCQCTDPECRTGTACVNRGRCCQDFGNVGATDY